MPAMSSVAYLQVMTRIRFVQREGHHCEGRSAKLEMVRRIQQTGHHNGNDVPQENKKQENA